jgi:AmiR/NasT family two-component response regulator
MGGEMSCLTSDTLLIHYTHMATTKRRLNISLSPEVETLVETLAKRDRVPAATKISQLLLTSLSIEEDKAFSLLAEARLKDKGKKLAHKDVWG